MPDKITAGYWRDRAEEVRVLAFRLTDHKLREQMLADARGYDKMAGRAEKLEKLPTLATGCYLHC